MPDGTKAIALAGLCLITGCTEVHVDSYEAWCDYIHAPEQDIDVFSMDREAIIEDVVALWNRFTMEAVAPIFGTSPESAGSDTLLAELREDRMVGAWREGDTLHVAVGLMVPTAVRDGMSPADDSTFYLDVLRDGLRAVRSPDARGSMDPAGFCTYQGIEIFFARLDVHTSFGVQPIETEAFHELKEIGIP